MRNSFFIFIILVLVSGCNSPKRVYKNVCINPCLQRLEIITVEYSYNLSRAQVQMQYLQCCHMVLHRKTLKIYPNFNIK